ncbi:hypothetical protein GOBAR_AA09621 [Gossypium barbadense]|uniref:Uncharacterized protein n=1 Tax=Gossypium barbadense TaxID=3634 RepID=A0A2P5Y5Z7_GOSBA|nr:hypothetical protein GOBAR_AA09621 [Gossypium barbadense]
MVREVGMAMRCGGAQRCQHMKPLHELDEKVVVAETVGPHAVEGHHQSMRVKDDSWATVSRSPKCRANRVPQRWRESRCLGAARIVGGRTWLAHDHVAWPWLFIIARAGGNLCPISTWPKAHPCARPCLCGKPVFKSSVSVVYLKSAKLGMTYLDCSERENAKYHKRDFFIQFGSDNVRICCI